LIQLSLMINDNFKLSNINKNLINLNNVEIHEKVKILLQLGQKFQFT